MQEILAVGIGGFIGAVLRYCVTGLMQRACPAFLPAGTLVVNVVGCFAIGVVMAFVSERVLVSEPWRLFLVTGILGGLTTFSAFGYESVELLREQELRLAFINVAANLALGFFAAWLGRLLGTTMA